MRVFDTWMDRLGPWLRANPLKFALVFIVLILLSPWVGDFIGGVIGFIAGFVLMFTAITLGVAHLRGGRH